MTRHEVPLHGQQLTFPELTERIVLIASGVLSQGESMPLRAATMPGATTVLRTLRRARPTPTVLTPARSVGQHSARNTTRSLRVRTPCAGGCWRPQHQRHDPTCNPKDRSMASCAAPPSPATAHPNAAPTRLQLAWDRGGSGEPLLLVHGIGTTRDDFAALRSRLEDEFDVVAVDLPGHGRSAPIMGRPTVAAVTDAIERDLDALGIGDVHVLGDSLGARIALELAVRGRALSVVAIAPSGLNLPPERILQGAAMSMARIIMRTIRPAIGPMSQTPLGRTMLLTGLRSHPWDASETEALALRAGFADARGYWSLLFWAILTDVPAGLDRITCPVILAQGTMDLISSAQTPRYLLGIRGARFRLLPGAGHAPQSDVPNTIIDLVRDAAGCRGSVRAA
ncbi:alpha/beta fold hydrolase [Pseudonocardia sp. GCM10023141]|uniref:alpha/beta fold hydrolase n=1 Tax=Pseudonocardia sp. GCM10023141 TaxID=3252653 RepID=UPI00360A5D71